MSFLTGSRAYGVPRDDSDWDLVVLVDDETRNKLWAASESGTTVRFGKLNLILPASGAAYETWERVTQELIAKRPVTREYAVEAFSYALGPTRGGAKNRPCYRDT